MLLQNRLQRLYGRDDIAVRRHVVVRQGAHLLQSLDATVRGAAVFDERDFLEKAPQNLDAVAALTALTPGLDERAIIMVIRRVFELVRRAALDRQLDAALALVGVPDAVVEAELHLL